MPSCTSSSVRNVAASTALPQPPNTNQNVPRNSAPSRAPSDGSRMMPPVLGPTGLRTDRAAV